MPTESTFVEVAMKVAKAVLASPLVVRRGAALLYQVAVDNHLSLTVDIKRPMRGNSAYQTDLAVFEEKSPEVSIPRVVMEFKTRITTHDVLTYSAKAAKHKQVYPYLRYGLIASDLATIPGRVFTHNESLDFCACVSGLTGKTLFRFFSSLLAAEIAASRRLEDIAFDTIQARLFRSEIVVDGFDQ